MSARMVDAALAAARRGWPVFPLRPDDKRPAVPDHTEPACTRRDPRCRHGHVGWEQRATTNPGRIRRGWATVDYGVGIACGPAGLVVIDLDTPKPVDTVRRGCRDIRDSRDTPGQEVGVCRGVAAGAATNATAATTGPVTADGRQVFAALCAAHDQPVPADTFTVRTRRGGLHLYFAHPADGPVLRNTTGGTSGSLGESIDTRSHGGYVVAAGSTVGGRPYEVIRDLPVAPLPGWLATLLRPAPLAPLPPVRLAFGADRRGAYVASAIHKQQNIIAGATEGGRNHAVFMSAVVLGQLAAGGALSADDVAAVLKPAGIAVGLAEREVDHAITNGLRYGARRPRQVNP
ncbi:MAG TPA: bifunctional DNA primase/polymerase [Actinocatenispora sp.]